MPLDPRVEFHRVVIKSHIKASSELTAESRSMILKAYSTGGQRSSRVASLAEANGLVVLPMLSSDGRGNKVSLESGEFAQAVVLGEIEME